jgi:hypothetical protein
MQRGNVRRKISEPTFQVNHGRKLAVDISHVASRYELFLCATVPIGSCWEPLLLGKVAAGNRYC